MRLKLWLRFILIRLASLFGEDELKGQETELRSKRNECRAVHEERTSERVAALIQQNEALIAGITAAHQTRERNQEFEQRRNRRPLWVAAIITGVYAIFAAEQWLTMRTQLESSSRAWVGMEGFQLNNVKYRHDGGMVSFSMNITYRLKNFGKSPARYEADAIRSFLRLIR